MDAHALASQGTGGNRRRGVQTADLPRARADWPIVLHCIAANAEGEIRAKDRDVQGAGARRRQGSEQSEDTGSREDLPSHPWNIC